MKNLYTKIQSWYFKAKDNWLFALSFFALSVFLPILLPILFKHLKLEDVSKFLNFLGYKVPIWSLLLSLLLTLMFRSLYKYIMNSGSLEILKATYGLESTVVDITERLKGEVIDNKLKIVLSNKIAGDPVPGKIKRGIIEYKIGRRKASKEYIEGDVIDIP